METLHFNFIDTPLGRMVVAVSERGLALLEFAEVAFPPAAERWHGVEWVQSAEKTAAWEEQLRQYFAGERRDFTLPLDLRGTEFQKKCWAALLAIPYGETRSYGDIARQVGCPAAMRAVGQANHHNPIAIVVPCHRVLTNDGKLGGYGGGLHRKEALLKLEGARLF